MPQPITFTCIRRPGSHCSQSDRPRDICSDKAGAEQDLAHRDEQRQRGSSAATCATIGKIALPELEKRGYDPGISLARSPAPARSGCRSRPRSPMVIYAVTANVSVLQVFLGGFLPASR